MPAGRGACALGHVAVAAENVTDGRACRPRPAGMAFTQDRQQLLGPPRMDAGAVLEDRRRHMVGRLRGEVLGPTGALFETLRAVLR